MILFYSFISCASLGQSGVNEYKKMIDSAIIMQPAQLEGNVYLIDQNNQPYILESDKSEQKFKSISIEAKENRKLIKRGIRIWKILPVLNKNQLMITIVDFYVSYRRKNYNFLNGGGANIKFEYSCEEKQWILIESNWLGI